MGITNTKHPDVARPAFINIFYPIYDDKDLKIEQVSIINFTMFYIARMYGDRVEKLFDYDEILCYPFHQEMKIQFQGDRYDYNENKFEPEKYYREVEDAMEKMYQKLKDYIFNYIGKHDKKISVPKEKIDAEMVAMSNGYFRDSLWKIYYHNFNDYEGIDQKYLPGKIQGMVATTLGYMSVPTFYIYLESNEEKDRIIYKYYRAVYEYAIKLLVQIAEKLYFFTLAEVKRVIEEKGIVDPNIKPIEGIDIPQQPSQAILPQQLVSYDDAYVQQIMNNMMQQPFIVPTSIESNIYMTEDCPVYIKQQVMKSMIIKQQIMMQQPIVPMPINSNIYMTQGCPVNVQSIMMMGQNPMNSDFFSKGIDPENQIAATNEIQSDSLEIEPDSISSYNALDTYNKSMTCLFAQIILKYKNGAV